MARQGVGHLGPRLRGGGPRRHRPGRGRGRRGDRREAPGRAPPARRGGPRRRRVRRADPPSSGGEALMHVPDGFLAPQITVPAYLAAAPLWAWAARRHFGSRAVDALPVMGSLTALAFVLQTLRVPVPGGTSIHLVGATLLALLYGPLAAFVCESVVLAVQALFFGTGGVTTLAVNALAMGLLGPGAGWLAFRAARRLGEGPAALLAAWLAASFLLSAVTDWRVLALALGVALAVFHAGAAARVRKVLRLALPLSLGASAASWSFERLAGRPGPGLAPMLALNLRTVLLAFLALAVLA